MHEPKKDSCTTITKSGFLYMEYLLKEFPYTLPTKPSAFITFVALVAFVRVSIWLGNFGIFKIFPSKHIDHFFFTKNGRIDLL